MNPELHQLVEEIISLTGAPRPGVMLADAPVLADEALADEEAGFYMIGLIGGKDVGKSALVNALVGRTITEQSSFGPGTGTVIAYAHEAQLEGLRSLLDAAVPNQYRIVTHSIPRLSRQVLLDLPDIDSVYDSHVQITRTMLKYMLYPLWIQSVEKYADREPQKLLASVAGGNDPRNFLFCLNKSDQVAQREGEAALRELRDDYSERLSRVLGLGESPRVWCISAIEPEQFDLPALRAALSQQKTQETISQSKQLATRQQGVSLLSWIDRQELPQRLARLERLQQSAEEMVHGRIGEPLLDRAVPAILDNPALRLTQADELMNKRVSRWPIVNILHVVLDPLTSLVRKRLSLQVQRGLEGAEELVDQHLVSLAPVRSGEGETSAAGPRLADLVQSTFAYLQQSHYDLSRLYSHRRLWESMDAQNAEIELRAKLAATVERQRQVLAERIASRRSIFGLLFRWVLTIGAALWFPFIQPVLEAMLSGGRQSALLIVRILGVSYLLKNVMFLLLYFAGLWLVIKWDTQRRVDRALQKWKRASHFDPSLSLTGQTLEWLTNLLEPIRTARQRMESLVQRADELRQSLQQDKAA